MSDVRDWGITVEKSWVIFFAIVSVFILIGTNKFMYCFEGLGGSFPADAFTALAITPQAFVEIPFGFSFTLWGIGVSFFAFCLSWGIFLIVALMPRNYMRGREHGTARWAKNKDAVHYADLEDPDNNIILSDTEQMVLKPKKFNLEYDRNKNICVIGGSGSGKTRYVIKPNLLQLNSSYVLTDPKGTLVPETGHLFREHGYEIKILNTIDFSSSMHYNPLAYIRNEKDILKFVNVLMKNTDGDKAGGGSDPFWEKAERLLYCALVGFIFENGSEEEKNMNTLVYLLDLAKASEEDENMESALDAMFRQVEKGEYYDKDLHKWVDNPHRQANPNSFAVGQYRKFKQAAGKTLKSILISCAARLAPFDIAELKEVMKYDELELDKIGDRKTILYAVMSDTDDTFAFLVAMMFYQMFNLLCDHADVDCGGKLPIPVQCLCDEFANIGKIPNFEKLISTIRSRGISAMIVLQSKTQLDSQYEKDAGTIIDCCDTLIFLGGKSTETNEEIAKMIGQATVDQQNITDQKGQNGSHSIAYQNLGRDLIQAPEIARMSRSECLVLISGEHAFKSKKYDLTRHPRYKYIDPGHDGALFKEPFNAAEYIAQLQAEREKKKADDRIKARVRMRAQRRKDKKMREARRRDMSQLPPKYDPTTQESVYFKAG